MSYDTTVTVTSVFILRLELLRLSLVKTDVAFTAPEREQKREKKKLLKIGLCYRTRSFARGPSPS